MRVSEFYDLGRTQPTLDFVDVDIREDTPVFVDPRALRLLRSHWAEECTSLVQNFFREVLDKIRSGEHEEARRLLGALHEPNETHLGLSRGLSRGRGLGAGLARGVWEALAESEAVHTGLLEDLEDTILLVEGISADIISDITTNIIREPHINYTSDMCAYYGIPLVTDVDSGPLWDPAAKEWYSELAMLPIADAGKLLLVPKVIVRRRLDYDVEEYYEHYVLEHLRGIELDANSELVRLLKNGRSRVTKKDLASKYGRGKSVIVRETRRHPEILDQYRSDKRASRARPLDHSEMAAYEGTPNPDWDALLSAVTGLAAGNDNATAYERAVEGLLSALLYPSLANPRPQEVIHDGRKRIDIGYSNAATQGFFYWLALNYAASNIFVECKNYSREIANPELDQLAGRFSPTRGRFGLIVCRRFDNKPLFLERCRDTARDERGFIICIDDDDLAVLVEERSLFNFRSEYHLLEDRFRYLIL